MKTSKKIISMLLCVVMVASTFCGLGLVLDDFVAEAAFNPNIKITHAESGITITQQRVVNAANDAYLSTYQGYQNRFFNGNRSNAPTNFVIPGLSATDNYIPQGLAYWEDMDWFLISAYDNSSAKKNSVVYAIDAKTAEFVKLFVLKNTDGTNCNTHGGGLSASKYNLYYTDSGSRIAYVSLDAMAKAVENTDAAYIQFADRMNLCGELNSASTSYCSYGSGTLWTGNFYIKNNDDYGTLGNQDYGSMLLGYKLFGNSSKEEWYYLRNNFNLVTLNSTGETTVTSGNASMKYTTTNDDGANAEIKGQVTATAATSEITAAFGYTSNAWNKNISGEKAYYDSSTNCITVGEEYVIEYDTTYKNTDVYIFSPTGKHMDVSQWVTPTQLEDGRWHYRAVFKAGTKPAGADSNWDTVAADDANFTGKYTIRFGIDNVPVGTTNFTISNLKITNNRHESWANTDYEGISCVGNPYYVVAFTGGKNNIDKIQYAIHDQGKLYLSRSYSRTTGSSHIREFSVGFVDINTPGDAGITVNGRNRKCYLVDYSKNFTLFGGSGAANGGSGNKSQMLYMGEGLISVGDNLYILNESSAWKYNGGESNKCPEPIDVLWEIDHHALLNEEKSYDDTTASHYEKVTSLNDINMGDDYLIVHESPVKDPLTQKNIIYALDAFGGYGDRYLPKYDNSSNSPTQALTGDSMGVVGYEIKDYTIDGNKLHINAEDDAHTSMRWQIKNSGTTTLEINSKELHFASNKHFNFGQRLFTMMSDTSAGVHDIRLEEYGDEAGNFVIYNTNGYYLWCNDGSNQSYIDTYTDYYRNHSNLGYLPNYNNTDELPGTFHADAKRASTAGGNLTGGDVGADMTIINIYKRVPDPYSSAYESRVYSDLRAELQADGTYNIILETYANSPLQYQKLSAQRPTDFIFLLDGSSSMWVNKDTSVGYHHDTSWNALQMGQIGGYNPENKDNCYNIEYKSSFYFRLPDGEYAPISVAVNKGTDGDFSRDIWLWCTHPVTGRCYKLSKNGYIIPNACSGAPSTDAPTRITDEAWLANPNICGYENASLILDEAKNDKNKTDYHKSRNSQDNRKKYEAFAGIYYEAPSKNMTMSRLEAMQLAVDDLTYKIAENAASTNLDHRIAVVSFGNELTDNSGFRTGLFTNTSTTLKGYSSLTTADYQNAFYTVDKFDYARCCINSLAVSYSYDETNCNTYSNYGFAMANQIVANSDANYLGGGDRSVAIIMITDGVPGVGTDDATVANRVANLAIAESLKSKNLGAYVYSIQIGNNSMSGFSMDDYMDFTSSEYLFAESMDAPGDRNINAINYSASMPTGTAFNLTELTNSMFDSVTSNSTNAMAKLEDESVLREKLMDAFIIPDDATIKTETASIYYDELDRLHFNAPVNASGITSTVNRDTREILVRGYNYSQNCVTRSNETNGKKLIVTISGVLANMDAELYNTSINQPEETAIYESDAKMAANDAVKRFPTEYFSVPEYNFIMDYDLPMLDTEVDGTLCAVDSEIRRQNVNHYNEVLDIENIKIAFTNSNQDLVYTLKQDEDKGYVLIKRDDGTYEWFRINIIPASNVYYEESRLTRVASDMSVCAWNTTSTASSGYQDTSTDSDVYGYDKYYNNTNEYSNGSYKTAVVNATTNRTETQTFTFTGKGFDLVSACGPDTGMLLVTIKQGDTIEKVILVDTYYSDANYGLLTQVPVLHYVTEDYATRTVEITGVYLKDIYEPKDQTAAASLDAEVDMSVPAEEIGMFAALGMPELDDMDIDAVWMDDNSVLNPESQIMTSADGTSTTVSRAGDKTLYLDGYRVYNTLEDDSRYIASEQNATYYNVEDELKNGEFEDLAEKFVAYVEGGKDGKEITFGNYTKNGIGGPAGEVYLEPDTAISFKIAATSISRAAIAPSVMIGMRNVSGTPTAKIKDAEIAITSKTEMYYDVSTLIDGQSTNGTTVYTVTVTNSGTGILAVNNIKLTNAELVATSAADLPTVANLMMMSATPVEVSTLNTRGYANQHPDYVPQQPGTTNPDPDLDPVSRPGDTKVDFGNIGDLINTGSVTPASFLAAILDIFKKLFANLGKLLFSI